MRKAIALSLALFLVGIWSLAQAQSPQVRQMLLLGAGKRAGGGSGATCPASLFSGDTGGLWVVSDHTTTFQDTAGTTPAVVAGDPVARVNDKSGNGNTILNSAGSTRPILRNSGALWWLEFDGVDDYLQAAFTLIQPLTDVLSAQQITFGASNNRVVAAGVGATYSDILQQTAAGTPTIELFAGLENASNTDMTVGVNHVLSAVFNGASSKLAVDNGSYTTGDVGAFNPGGYTIASYGSLAAFTNMLYFGGIRIGRVLTAPEIARCRTFFGAQAGLTL